MAKEDLERRVYERTASLQELNETLVREIEERRRIARELERTIASCAGGKRGQCAILGALRQRPTPRDIHDAKQGACGVR